MRPSIILSIFVFWFSSTYAFAKPDQWKKTKLSMHELVVLGYEVKAFAGFASPGLIYSWTLQKEKSVFGCLQSPGPSAQLWCSELVAPYNAK